jgi:hypothetical protein
MLRRIIFLALACSALAASPALADSHWNSQMKDASATASRSPGGCTITAAGSHPGPVSVTCGHRQHATLVYSFPVRKGAQITGKPWCGVASSGPVSHSWKISGGALLVTVIVTEGRARLSTISVGYYTK